MPFTPKRLGSVAYSLVMFLVVSVLAGVLIAGLFVPVAGIAGVSSKAAADELDNIEAALATPVPPTRSRVLMADGKLLAYFYDENRIYVPLNKIAPIMRQAQVAIEDHRFYEHGALDIKGTLRALVRNTSGEGNTQGGSSITQQYVKMTLVEACRGDKACVDEATAPNLSRKIRELRYAIALEKRFSKNQILERYLNIAYYGDGAYGIESAARHYYNKNASQLNLGEATMLAGLVQNPHASNPVTNMTAALDRRDVVANRMAELKIITAPQARAAKTSKIDVTKIKRTRNGCLGTQFPFLCDYVYRSLLNDPALGRNREEREATVKRGGLTIQTKIDPKTQREAEKSVAKVVGPTDPVISTMNMIEPGTGLIVAMAQSRPKMGSDKAKGETFWNLSVEPAMGGIQGYQAGSTFKAFTAAAALEKGIPLSKKYNAKHSMNLGGKSFSSCEGREQIFGKWKVTNSTTSGDKIMEMYEAAQKSVNTYFAQLVMDVGMCPTTKMAEKLGVKLGTKDRELVGYYQHIPAFTLGSVEVSPLSMAEAYATFAARGIHCDPIIIEKVTDRTGKELDVKKGNCQRVMSEDVADGMNKLLASVVTKGTGARAQTADSRPQAGKTGTINSNEAVWYVGYTPEIAGAAMISIDNTRKPFMRKKPGFKRSGVKNYEVPSTGFDLEGSGSGDAGQDIWKPTMERYLRDVPKTGFKAPPSKIERGKVVDIPRIFGLGMRAGTKKLEEAGFTVVSTSVYSRLPEGSFLGFDPEPGGRAPEFSTIFARYSKGRDPEVVAAENRAEARAEARAERAERNAERKAEQAKKKREAAEKKKKKAADKPGG